MGNVADGEGGGEAGGTLSLRTKQRPGPPAVSTMLRASDLMPQERGASELRAGPRSPTPAPQSTLLGSSPSVLGEEVSRETAGPHLQGLMGKEVRQV